MSSCARSCHRGTYYCSTMDDCMHRAHLQKAPRWLTALICSRSTMLGIHQLRGTHYRNPLRERFHYPGTFMGYGPALITELITMQNVLDDSNVGKTARFCS